MTHERVPNMTDGRVPGVTNAHVPSFPDGVPGSHDSASTAIVKKELDAPMEDAAGDAEGEDDDDDDGGTAE